MILVTRGSQGIKWREPWKWLRLGLSCFPKEPPVGSASSERAWDYKLGKCSEKHHAPPHLPMLGRVISLWTILLSLESLALLNHFPPLNLNHSSKNPETGLCHCPSMRPRKEEKGRDLQEDNGMLLSKFSFFSRVFIFEDLRIHFLLKKKKWSHSAIPSRKIKGYFHGRNKK